MHKEMIQTLRIFLYVRQHKQTGIRSNISSVETSAFKELALVIVWLLILTNP